MKKFGKLSRATRPQEQPDGTYPFGKNGIQDYIKGSVFNEPGFTLSSAQIPYVPIGIIETDKFPIILSTNNMNSAIGVFDVDNDVYTAVLDDATLPFKLPFDSTHYITGQAQRNYKGELVCAFTDKNGVPYYVNIDNPNANTLNDIKLFPNALPAGINCSVTTGGVLFPGAYYAAVRYTKKDGTETSFVSVSAPKVVSGTSGQATDSALLINLTNIDPDYDFVQVAIVSKINGILSAVQFTNPTPAIGSSTILYSGTELTESITLEEILTPRKVYTKVGTMGQLNDSLYIADLESAPQVNMQKWANMIRLKWHSKLITVDPVYIPHSTGEEKSHMHKEVYAMYIRYKLADGTNTAGFMIPGEPLTSADRATSTIASAEGITAAKYQVEDTIPSFNAADKSGYFGKWENASETYPDTPDFDSSALGGENLRNQRVRHHRFPSIAWCKTNLYSGVTNYGRNALDMLGVSVENVIIPSQYADKIIGWELFYAKRNVANSTIIGQSLVLNGARNKSEPALSPNNYYSTGGNWNSLINFRTTETHPLYLDGSIFHFYSFDMLLNKPSVSPDYLDFQLKHSRLNISSTQGQIENQNVHAANDGPITFNLDYLQKGTPPVLPTKSIKAIKGTSYVPNNIELGKWHNAGIEGFFGGTFTHPEALIPSGEVKTLSVNPGSRAPRTELADVPQQESTFLANLMSVKSQLFAPFTAQSLVREGISSSINDTQVFFGGDVYICDYTFHTYGIWVSDQGQKEGDFGSMYMGTKVARRFVCESVSNLYNRYEDAANVYSKYYPKSPMIPEDQSNYLTAFIRTNDPNQFGYKKDSNALDDLFSIDIFNAYAEDLFQHPYRIHRMGKLSKQTKVRNWRTCLPLDYYEMQKNMGKPIHLEGMDDRLIIHCENAMFLTQDKTKLDTDVISVTLGSGDIFQFAPQEAMSAKLGYAGTQHDLACVRTPFGYVFIDSKEGQIFIYKGQLELINKELNAFFIDFLRLKKNNPFIGNGYTIGYDPKYKRLLLTVKNVNLVSGAQNIPVYDPANISSYTTGDILYKDGRIVRFLGVNATNYNCPAVIVPIANNLSITINENTPVGTQIGRITGSDVTDFYIDGVASPFAIDPSSGRVKVVSPISPSNYAFTGKGYSVNGNFDTFNLNVVVTPVNQAPVVNNAEVYIDDTTPTNTTVVNVTASDRDGDALVYSITAGNVDNTFSINSTTGQIKVADGTKLNGLVIPMYILTVNVSDGTRNSTGTVTVHIAHINQAPLVQDFTYTMLDSAASGSLVATLEPAFDLENDSIVYTLISESVPGVFTIDLTTLQIRLTNSSFINPAVTNQYQLHLSASDGVAGHEPQTFTVYINVLFDRTSFKFEPAVGSCLPGAVTCAPGYTLSPDGSVCTKVSTVPPTITGSGACLALSTNYDYGQFFARIYNAGWADSSIALFSAPAGDVYAQMATTYWQGVPNDIGVWVDSDCDGTKDSLAAGTQTTISYAYNNTGSAKTVYVGIFGDNQFVLKVNGVQIARTTNPSSSNNFKILHIFPVQLINGLNIFNAIGTGDGSVNDTVGMIVYDNAPATIQAAANDSALNILFTTKTLRGTSNIISTCPDGYVLDTTGAPICKKIETDAPIVGSSTTKRWSKVNVAKANTGTLILQLNNQSTPQFFQDVQVPYYPDVTNHVDCGGSVTTYYNVQKSGSAQKNNCSSGTGSVVTYVVPAGLYRATSQAAADALAQADVDANKQTYANNHGNCN